MRQLVLAASAAAVLVPLTAAQSLTTIYARNNGGSNGGAVYFDVSVTNPGGLTVTSLDTNTAETVPLEMTVYITPNTHVGNEANQAVWIEVSRGAGVGMGNNIPTAIDLADFFLAPGNYGVALVMSAAAGHDYTNGNGTNEVYSNGDLTITCGAATNVPFTGSPFTPRVWNGTLYYSGRGNSVSAYGRYGEGCRGSNGVAPELSANLPKLNMPFTVTVTGVATSAPVGFITYSISKSQWGAFALPLDMTPFGGTGCHVLAAPLFSVPAPNAGGTLTSQITMPNDMALLDKSFQNQALILDAGANPIGVVGSNGGEGVIGL